ncbi:hypothetical protein LCGC14_2244700 [marine sediment metagenome]|uniref:Uncharacterized protein n=1 Tax=marine sediment metagenome TaxID=412755 RepID=A0A0F9FZE5_9ZZZZ
MRTGWKVILSKNRVSVIISPPHAVVYPAGWWVRPREGCGPLSVFARRLDALSWALDEAGLDEGSSLSKMGSRVVRCEYKPSFRRSMWLPKNTFCILYDSSSPRRMRLREAPEGTRLARALKCLE